MSHSAIITSALNTSTEGGSVTHDAEGVPALFIKPLRMGADIKGLAKYASGDVRGDVEARKALNINSSDSEAGDSSCSSNVSLTVHCSDRSASSSADSFILEMEEKDRSREEKLNRSTSPHRRKETVKVRTPKRRPVINKSPIRKCRKVKRRRMLRVTTMRKLKTTLKVLATQHNVKNRAHCNE